MLQTWEVTEVSTSSVLLRNDFKLRLGKTKYYKLHEFFFLNRRVYFCGFVLGWFLVHFCGFFSFFIIFYPNLVWDEVFLCFLVLFFVCLGFVVVFFGFPPPITELVHRPLFFLWVHGVARERSKVMPSVLPIKLFHFGSFLTGPEELAVYAALSHKLATFFNESINCL